VSAGEMDRLVAFDRRTEVPNGAGGSRPGWDEVFQAWGSVRYQRGAESEDAGGQSVSARFKLRIYNTPGARALTGQHSMRDVETGARFNIREIDALSDRAFVWLTVESGVAV